MKKVFQSLLPDIIAVAVFVVLSFLFFSPSFEGKVLYQNDMTHVEGMSQELKAFKEQTGEVSMWTNSMFGGMPAYLIVGGKTNNIFHALQPVLRLFLPYFTVGILFVYLFGFYFLLRVLKTAPLLSFIGATAFAFGSYNLIIIAAGHVTKAYAIGYMAPVIAGVLLTFQGRYIFGGLVSLFAIGIQISANHVQITYYTFLIIGVFIIYKFVETIREKNYRNFFIAFSLTAGSIIFSVIPNITSLWTVYEYGKYSTRGAAELSDASGEKSKALSKDYILNDYSFEITEPITLLIPNFKGGPSVSALSTNSDMYKLLVKNGYPKREAESVIERMPTYYGPQLSTAGPVYAGAIAFFLFVFAMFLLKGPTRWWILTAIGFSIALAWGKHFPALSHLFIDYFPVYGKFRTVSMILVVTSLLIPFAASLGLNPVLKGEIPKKEIFKALKYSFIVTAGFALLVAIIGPGAIDFSSSSDASLPDIYKKAMQSDRAGLLRADAFRSLGFIVVTAILIWGLMKEKIRQNHFLIALSLLVLIDLWVVSKRYVNESNYVSARVHKSQYNPTAADLQILKDNSYYRVLNLAANTFNDATTSYFHKSIGGYHGAKVKRYQDLIERQISRNNFEVLNMLNTKYLIVPGQEKGTQEVNENPQALGNVWFIDTLIWVNTPDEEMEALTNIKPSEEAIINTKFSEIPDIDVVQPSGGSDTIYLTSYSPNELNYFSKTSGKRFAVFSEIYYPKGWEVSVDGKEVEYAQVNYVLRGMMVPEGEHNIKFRFHPKSYYLGHSIALGSSVLSVLLLLGGIVWKIKKKE
jgi:MFS family permease